MPNIIAMNGGGSSSSNAGVCGMMQQVKLPRSNLKANASSFVQEDVVYLNGFSSSSYSTTITWGDNIYWFKGGTNLLYIYNKTTKTTTSKSYPYSDAKSRFDYIIVGSKAYLMSRYYKYFNVLDLETNEITPLARPNAGYDSDAYYIEYVPVCMRYDPIYNKIYTFCSDTNPDSSNDDRTSYSIHCYDVASNSWIRLYKYSSFSTSNSDIYGKGCLIDFSETQVKFVSNMFKTTGIPWSFTVPRTASPSSGIYNANETIFTALQGNTSSSSQGTTMIGTDEQVFGLTGSKLFQFNLFTGDTTEDNILGAVPVSKTSSYTAFYTYGVTYYDGKLYYSDGERLYSMDCSPITGEEGPLVWKIFKGHKYNALSPITLHKADGSFITIGTQQKIAEEDIEIHIGEYDTASTEKYLLIEN